VSGELLRRFCEPGGLARIFESAAAAAARAECAPRIRRVSIRSAAVSICAFVWSFGCDAGDRPLSCEPQLAASDSSTSAFWDPVAPVLNLIGCPMVVVGSAPPAAAPVQWVGERAAEWTVAPDPSGARITSPDLSGYADLTVFSFRLRASGAREAIATPLLDDGGKESNQRVWRTVRQVLDQAPDSTEPTLISFDLTEAIRGNWLDETRHGALARIEILVLGADAAETKLESVSAERSEFRFDAAAAAVERIDRGGIIRPSWFVHAGAQVRVTARVPAGSAELRWHGGGAIRRVRAIDGSREIEIAHHPGTEDPWTFHAVSLDRWLGREITLEFSVEGAGLGFFGDPRIVSVGEANGRPLAIVYMIDTLRADRVGAWGSEPPDQTPTLDRLAAEGAVFKSAMSASAWTKPAIPTLMTGIMPSTHGVGARTYADRLPESVPVVQQIFRDAGWRTASISASPLGSSLSGLERGFGAAVLPRYWRGRIGERNYAIAADLHDALLAWHAEEPDQPAFAYVHSIDVHQYQRPYYRSESFAGVHPYDAAVRDADRQIGELLTQIAAAPRKPDPALIVVSDHGEAFGDHGMTGHGRGLYQSQIHVPLIFWSPGRIEPIEVHHPVGLADLAPTLLEMAGLSFPISVQGRSLVPYLRGNHEPIHEYLGASLLHFPWEPDAPKRFALISNEMAKIIASTDGRTYAFDLSADPAERSPLNPISPPLVSAIQRWISEQGLAMQAFQREHGAHETGFVDAAQTEQLRELGYIE
jgi:arylsulfatase A-like enzyme